MNIIITLPNHLIEAIKTGRKTVEVRTDIPKNFNPEINCVFVCQKGTLEVPLSFTVKKFTYHYSWIDIRENILDRVAVSSSFLYDYYQKREFIYAWWIDQVSVLNPTLCLKRHFAVERAPQRWVYA